MVGHLGNFTGHFAIFGAVCTGYLALVMGKKLLSLGLRVIRRSFAVDLPKYGRWAVITGSTDGLGRNYAVQLAEKGMDVVLISRNPQKLFAVAEEIRKDIFVWRFVPATRLPYSFEEGFPRDITARSKRELRELSKVRMARIGLNRCSSKTEVRLLWADFEKTDVYDSLNDELCNLDIGILVNSVGLSYHKFPEYFCEGDDYEEKSMDMINLTVLSYVMLTNLVLPGMLKRKRGVIINVGSCAGLRPVPFYSLCSATKAFIHFFTAAINMEYSSQGVSCQLVIPNLLDTGKRKAPKIMWSHPQADMFVQKAIQTIGREPITGVHWPHELEQMISMHFLTNSMLRCMMLKQIKRRVKFTKRGNMSHPSAGSTGLSV